MSRIEEKQRGRECVSDCQVENDKNAVSNSILRPFIDGSRGWGGEGAGAEVPSGTEEGKEVPTVT